jgi:hypothetical protein
MTVESMKNSKFYFCLRSFVLKYYRTGLEILRRINPQFKIRGTGGTISSRYCYSVFMRHIVHLYHNGMTKIPNRVAEFGPGDSIGIGLCAILAGVNEYYALDVVDHANDIRNLKIFNELVELFKKRANIPDNKEFPKIRPLLDDYSFPSHIFNDAALERNLSEERLSSIKYALAPHVHEKPSCEIKIKYIVPWEKYSGNYPFVDFVFSQAVLEHVDNLDCFYHIMSKMLVDGGFVSHDIDFKSHGETYEWNGHWAISDTKWAKIRGTRPYLINREPLSSHLQLFKKSGFQIIAKLPCSGSIEGRPSIYRKRLVDKFVDLSDEDFETSSCYIIAQKI